MRQCINKSYHAALITSENQELREVDMEPNSKRGNIDEKAGLFIKLAFFNIYIYTTLTLNVYTFCFSLSFLSL